LVLFANAFNGTWQWALPKLKFGWFDWFRWLDGLNRLQLAYKRELLPLGPIYRIGP
jgi:hypothetical protein